MAMNGPPAGDLSLPVRQLEIHNVPDPPLLLTKQCDEAKPDPVFASGSNDGSVDRDGKGAVRGKELQLKASSQGKRSVASDATTSNREVVDQALRGMSGRRWNRCVKPDRIQDRDPVVVSLGGRDGVPGEGTKAKPAKLAAEGNDAKQCEQSISLEPMRSWSNFRCPAAGTGL